MDLDIKTTFSRSPISQKNMAIPPLRDLGGGSNPEKVVK